MSDPHDTLPGARGPRSPTAQAGRRTLLVQLASASTLAAAALPGCAGLGRGTENEADASEWASGGTSSMTARDSYPDPFVDDVPVCALLAPMTAGPCTTAAVQRRQDVSEGWSGLPIRLALRVVDADCVAVAGVYVQIWHTNREGSYSGQTPEPDRCLIDPGYATSDFFRGVQTTDDDGLVHFDTCLPGWYPGRAVHIHVLLERDGQTSPASQLFFPEDVTDAILEAHPEYADFGPADRTHDTDSVMSRVAEADRARHVLDVARMSDGAMLASKTIALG